MLIRSLKSCDGGRTSVRWSCRPVRVNSSESFESSSLISSSCNIALIVLFWAELSDIIVDVLSVDGDVSCAVCSV
ncbi:hypothetical protein SK128_023715, partial [Halocaridina rubra]